MYLYPNDALEIAHTCYHHKIQLSSVFQRTPDQLLSPAWSEYVYDDWYKYPD